MPLSRRSFLAATAAAAASTAAGVPVRAWPAALRPPSSRLFLPQQQRPTPTESQLLWQRDELAMFIHFGINTFTNREWGTGTEDPALFNPPNLDADQWARVAREAGFRALILTAKHHDGFCLWPTATTRHSVASSPWKSGKGDVVREVADACRRHNLRLGLYCSPWDRNHPTYGDSSKYNDVFHAQLRELLTQYGDVHEVWFDGANGEGPNGKRQIYDWPANFALVRELQPSAVIFSDAGPDIRWIGNERGVAGDTNWSTIRSSAVPFPGASGDGITEALQSGHPDGDVWRPGETDVSIRPGWFYHPAEDSRVKSVDDLISIYFSSVGRNSKLLLNVPPTPEGVIHSADVARLQGMRARLDDIFSPARVVRTDLNNFVPGSSASAPYREVRIPNPASIAILELAEDITKGQRVARWSFEVDSGNGYRQVATGTTIGHRTLRQIPPTLASGVRVRVMESVGEPLPISVTLYTDS